MRKFIDLVEAPSKPSDEQTDVDVTVWHVTRQTDVAKIMRQGLTPRRGARSRSAGEKQAAIFVFPDSISLEDAMTNWLDDEFEDIPLSLLELTVPAAWVTQHALRWEAAITQTVPPDRIRLLVPDMDTWHGQYPGGSPPTGWFPAD